MFNTSFNISINTKQLDQKLLKAFSQTAEALRTDVYQEQVVPFDSGELQRDIYVNEQKINSGIITLSQRSVNSTNPLDYSLRMYFHPEYNFQTINNPNAQGLWYEMWINGAKKHFLRDAFKKIYRRI